MAFLEAICSALWIVARAAAIAASGAVGVMLATSAAFVAMSVAGCVLRQMADSAVLFGCTCAARARTPVLSAVSSKVVSTFRAYSFSGIPLSKTPAQDAGAAGERELRRNTTGDVQEACFNTISRKHLTEIAPIVHFGAGAVPVVRIALSFIGAARSG